ncbi:hypothetical protein RR46_08804 [Papilio xuthus]|uniref:RRM domain-containing protein n=2 Tax=Papilio xuthus TaxID=66420 RepID=A0A194PW35_PAPXU|nr:hypothetical protein RR46_08804 [Papilio xuthus]
MKSNLVTSNTVGETGEKNTDENQPLNNVLNKNARKKDKVKSAQVSYNSESVVNTEMGKIKPKKRNKSVSFMLDDKEEVVVKKTKSDITTHKQDTINNENNRKKQKKNKKSQDRVENDDVDMKKEDITSNSIDKTMNLKRNILQKLDNEYSDPTKRKINKKVKKNIKGKESGDSNIENVNLINKSQETTDNKKKQLQHKEIDTNVGTSTTDNKSSVEPKKAKKKKNITNAQNNETEIDSDKCKKNENKPEVIAGNLENLSIGDNTHTLSNLLDEMTVVDKKKRKKNKINKKRDKQPEAETKAEIEGSKEKEKWQKKRWNKGKKGKDDPDKGMHPVNVENLPFSIILSYKKLLAEHFAQCGTVRRVGIAQIYPSEGIKPVFNTTVYFDTAADAMKALEEDNTSFEGTTIRVLKPFPPTETTAVVRTYGPLTEQIISTMFSNVGRIRRIRHLIKGKKSMSTAFVELDEPEAVERAMKMAEEVRVGGKKVYVTKFQLHEKPKKNKKKSNTIDKVDEKRPAVNDDEDSDDSDDDKND